MGLTEIIYSTALIFGGIVFLVLICSFFASRSQKKKMDNRFNLQCSVQPAPKIKVVRDEEYQNYHRNYTQNDRMKRVS